MSTTPRRAAFLTPLVLLGLALNGCGVSDDEIRPGLAAQVDGTDIPVSDLDETVDGTCDFLDAQPDGPAFPRVTVRRLLVETLVRQEAAERLVDELGLDLPASYAGELARIDANYADAADEQADAMRAGDTASTYVALASDTIGNALLREETGSEPADAQEIRDRGTRAIDEWIASHDVQLNPTYGLRIDEGQFVTDDGLSVPVSGPAVFAQDVSGININTADTEGLAEAISEAVAGLPADQVCGNPAA